MKIRKNLHNNILKGIVKKSVAVILTLAAIALQFAFYYLVIADKIKVWYLRLGLGLSAFIFVVLVNRRGINPGFKIAWTIYILSVPLLGMLSYALFGGGKSMPKRKSARINAFIDTCRNSDDKSEELREFDRTGYMLAKTIYSTSRYTLYENTCTQFFSEIKDKHEALLKDIYSAQKYIFIEYFIISDGAVLESIIEALEKKGAEGIRIKFLFDDIGSMKHLKDKTKRRIAAVPNLELCVYEPVRAAVLSPRVNYRDHRKLAVVDGKIGYLGGDNLADEYSNRIQKFGYWRDNAVRLEGEAVYSLVLMFTEMWYLSCGDKLDAADYRSGHTTGCDGYVVPFGDGPTNTLHPSYNLFKAMVASAKKYIYLSTPYFILDSSFIDLLDMAATGGVEVKLLMPAVPDKKIIFAMTRGHYGDILRAGGKIYEYSPGFNHAKNIIVDGKYAFIGSVNCDYRSMFLHFENGVLLIGGETVEKMSEDFVDALKKSREIVKEEWKKRSALLKCAEAVLNLASPLV